MGTRGSSRAESNLAVGHGGLGVPGSVIDCCTREIVSWNLSHRCRTEEALDAVEQAVLARLPEGSREARVTLI